MLNVAQGSRPPRLASRMAGRSALHLNGRAKALHYKSAPKVRYVHSIGISFLNNCRGGPPSPSRDRDGIGRRDMLGVHNWFRIISELDSFDTCLAKPGLGQGSGPGI